MSQTSYVEIITVLESLPTLIREKRRRDGLSLRQAGTDLGLSYSTIFRAEDGRGITLAHAILLLGWVAA